MRRGTLERELLECVSVAAAPVAIMREEDAGGSERT
jgi:hypothetical protein